jgi:hypothetical protein
VAFTMDNRQLSIYNCQRWWCEMQQGGDSSPPCLCYNDETEKMCYLRMTIFFAETKSPATSLKIYTPLATFFALKVTE